MKRLLFLALFSWLLTAASPAHASETPLPMPVAKTSPEAGQLRTLQAVWAGGFAGSVFAPVPLLGGAFMSLVTFEERPVRIGLTMTEAFMVLGPPAMLLPTLKARQIRIEQGYRVGPVPAIISGGLWGVSVLSLATAEVSFRSIGRADDIDTQFGLAFLGTLAVPVSVAAYVGSVVSGTIFGVKTYNRPNPDRRRASVGLVPVLSRERPGAALVVVF
ncbi:MAG: hypothetical protein H6739_39590 [Alphaproteobacteria bacterium]|nr:hypothetical protein [Alphaproteobacteria bacterium]